MPITHQPHFTHLVFFIQIISFNNQMNQSSAILLSAPDLAIIDHSLWYLLSSVMFESHLSSLAFLMFSFVHNLSETPFSQI